MTRNLSKYARCLALGAMTALALVAGSVPVKAEVRMIDPRTQVLTIWDNNTFASAYAKTAADRHTIRQVAGNVSCGGYNAKVSSCTELDGMELFQRMGTASDGGRSAGATGN